MTELSTLVKTLDSNRFGAICLLILAIINLIPAIIEALIALFRP